MSMEALAPGGLKGKGVEKTENTEETVHKPTDPFEVKSKRSLDSRSKRHCHSSRLTEVTVK